MREIRVHLLSLLLFLYSAVVTSQQQFTTHCVLPSNGALILEVDGSSMSIVDKRLKVMRPYYDLIELAEPLLNRGIPSWLRDRMEIALMHLSHEMQAELIDVIANTDRDLRDELCYMIANLPPEELNSITIIHNIKEDLLKFKEIVDELSNRLEEPYFEIVNMERGDNDWYTTINYRIYTTYSSSIQWELPYLYYYEYVVSPIVDREGLLRIDPATGNLSSEGKLWREYFWQDYTDSIGKSYHVPFIMKKPNVITEEDLLNIDWGVISPLNYVIEAEDNKDLLAVIVDSADEPLMVIKTLGDSFCCGNIFPVPDGEIIFSLLPVEEIYEAGYPQLLQNMINGGAGNTDLRRSIVTGYDNGQAITIDGKVLIVKEREPFGLEEDPNELILAELGIDYDVITPQELLTLQLTNSLPPYHPLEYVKIIIPSDQPFNQFIPEVKDKLEEYVDHGGILEIHAYSSSDRNLHIQFPGDIVVRKVGEPIDSLYIKGFPVLGEEFPSDSKLYMEIGTLNTDKGLMKFIWEWIAEELPRNIMEESYWQEGALEHVQQPVRILYNHYGDYEELQKVVTSVFRIFLLPVRSVEAATDSLYWNEIYLMDRWIPFQVLWSGLGVKAQDWGVSMDRNTGKGMKDIKAVISRRLNGEIEEILGEGDLITLQDGTITGDYSKYVRVNFKVVDKNEVPIPSSVVKIALDEAGNEIVIWGYTDIDGSFSVVLGNNNNYYASVCRGDLGCYPEDGSFVKVIDKNNAPHGYERNVTMRFPVALKYRILERSISSQYKIRLSLKIDKVFLRGVDDINGYTVIKESELKEFPQIYLLDRANYEAWENGADEVYGIKGKIDEEGNVEIDVPEELIDSEFYLLILSPDEYRFYSLELEEQQSLYGCNTEGSCGLGCYPPEDCAQRCSRGWCCYPVEGFCGCCEYYTDECIYQGGRWDCYESGYCRCEALWLDDWVETDYDRIIFCGCRIIAPDKPMNNISFLFISLFLSYVLLRVIRRGKER